MKVAYQSAGLLVFLISLAELAADVKASDENQVESGFAPMFNGKDLTGWVNVNCALNTFFVKDREIITTGRPTGYLRTAGQYENFIADFEWMHVNKTEVGNSGFFVWADPLPAVGSPYTRGIEVQVLVNLEKEGYYTSQGDLFSIHGATCKPDRPHPRGWERCLPSERRCKGGGEWNHYKVIANNGTIKLHVNGKEVSGISDCRPRKGYLALESEGAECHFRNLKIKVLPGSNLKPEAAGDASKNFKNLYMGLDLSGWKADETVVSHWQPHDSVLHFDGKTDQKDQSLRSRKEYGDCELLADFRFPERKSRPCTFSFRAQNKSDPIFDIKIDPTGSYSVQTRLARSGSMTLPGMSPAGQWNRLQLVVAKDGFKATMNGHPIALPNMQAAGPINAAIVLHPEGEQDFTNLFVRELK